MEEPELVTMKAQVYRDPRPEAYFDRFYERAETREPDWVYDLIKILTMLYSWVFIRTRAIRAEKVPPEGAAIIAPNHFSHMDHFFVATPLRRRVRFMAKSQMFQWPLQWFFSHGGAFPIRRGYRDERAFGIARGIVRRGGVVVMYCEGGRSRTGALAEKAKPGIGRLALQTGAPVVPTAIFGSSHVRNWRRLQFPKVTVLYGDPIRWERIDDPTREQQQAVADAILTEIKALYAQLEAEGRRGVLRRQRALRRKARKRPATA
jgi:1-acyl-sn-glycerol-3-phosphate acyltransferase